MCKPEMQSKIVRSHSVPGFDHLHSTLYSGTNLHFCRGLCFQHKSFVNRKRLQPIKIQSDERACCTFSSHVSTQMWFIRASTSTFCSASHCGLSERGGGAAYSPPRACPTGRVVTPEQARRRRLSAMSHNSPAGRQTAQLESSDDWCLSQPAVVRRTIRDWCVCCRSGGGRA